MSRAVDRDDGRPPRDAPPVVQAEVEGRPRGDDQVGFSQRLSARVSHVEIVAATEQPTRHPREVGRNPQPPDGRAKLVGQLRTLQAAAAEQEQLLRARGEHCSGPLDLARARIQRRDASRASHRRFTHSRENAVEVPPHVPSRQARAPARGRSEPRLVELADHLLRVEKVERRLQEDGSRNAGTRFEKRALDGGNEIAHTLERLQPFHVRPHQRDLVDVLKRAATLQQGRGGAADQHDGRLGELCVLDGCDGVGEAGSGGDARDSRHAREAGHRVGGVHRRGLVTNVDDAYFGGLGAQQQRRDVPSAQGEDESHPVCRQRFGHHAATVPHLRRTHDAQCSHSSQHARLDVRSLLNRILHI